MVLFPHLLQDKHDVSSSDNYKPQLSSNLRSYIQKAKSLGVVAKIESDKEATNEPYLHSAVWYHRY